MTPRLAEPKDLEPLARLWDVAFPGARTIADRIRQLETGVPYGGRDVTFVEEDAGRIVGAFRAYRMTEYLAGRPAPMLGLAGVAVAPSARRRGIGRRLGEAAIRVGRERGDAVSVLYPFRPSFYRALGWGTVGELRAFHFRPDALHDADERSAVRAATDRELDALLACYDRVASRSHGPIRRDLESWRHRIVARSLRPFVYDDDGVRGYLLAGFRPGESPENGRLEVPELVAEHDAAYRGLLGWIACQGDQWTSVLYHARPGERFEHRLADPRPPRYEPHRGLWYPTSTVLRGPMLRVLDVPAALRARASWGEPGEAALSLRLEVDDPQVPENRGPWILAVEPTGAEVRRANGVRADVGLTTDVATFAQIYAGELTPSGAADLGLARVDGAAVALDRAFQVTEPFRLLDEF